MKSLKLKYFLVSAPLFIGILSGIQALDVAGKVKNIASGAASKAGSFLAKPVVKKLRPKYNRENPHATTPATARVGNGLSNEEISVIINRMPYTHAALESFLGHEIPADENLNIGFCASGGGYRAMVSTIGWLVGAHRIGLLDTATYASGLSGGTWALGAWTSSNLSITDFKQDLISSTQGMLAMQGNKVLPPPSGQSLKDFINHSMAKYLFGQPLSAVDLWGAMISNKLFNSYQNTQNFYLSGQQELIADGSKIFPIYTAVNPRGDINYHWWEFTPFEVGSPDIGVYVPTWAFGRKFVSGSTPGKDTNSGLQFAPEQSLGFGMGIWGSAFTVNLNEILDMARKDESSSDEDVAGLEAKAAMIDSFAKIVGANDIKNERMMPAKIFNPSFQMRSPTSSEKTTTLVDAGLAFNLPLPPLQWPKRALDIIIVFDASADNGTSGELRKAENYSREMGLPFPAIDYEKAKSQSMSVFADEDPSVPVIFYFRLSKEILDNEAFSTFNFEYTPETLNQLSGFTENSIVSNWEEIKLLFEDILKRKYS